MPAPGLAEIANDQFASRLQRIVQSLVHLGAIDTKVSNVVIGIEKRHEIEIMHTRWRRILERPHRGDDIGGRRGLEPRIEPVLDARKGGFRILRINFAARRDGARQKFRFPAVYREDVEDFHAGLRADECQPLRWRAVGVELAIRVAPIGSGDNRIVVRGGLRGRRRRGRDSGQRQQASKDPMFQPLK